MDTEQPSQQYIEAIEEHRLYLRDVNYQNQRDRDKTVLSLSGGALVLSVTFLSQIANDPSCSLWALVVAWGALVISMAAVVFSYPSADREVEANLAAVDKWLEQPTSERPQIVPARVSPKLNLLAPFALVLGLLFLAVFAFLNLN